MQECFKNIRDVDKKIRLLEFYVFGNVTVFEANGFSLLETGQILEKQVWDCKKVTAQ